MNANEIDYWAMSDDELRAAWKVASAANLATDYDGTFAELILFTEDAILQRIGAPDDADGDEPVWQNKIRSFGEAA